MKLSELIKQAQDLLTMHGDLDCISEEDFAINSLCLEVSEGQYPDDWGMPEGFTFIRVEEDR